MSNIVCIFQCEDANCNLSHPVTSKTEIDEEFYCGICMELMVSPVCCQEGHSWCKECINHWLKSRYTCPMDKQYLTVLNLTRNRPLENMISHLNVACRRQKEGCEWVGHRRHIKLHDISCKFRMTTCSYCLEDNIQAKDMEKHKEECELVPVPCPYESIGCVHKIKRCDLSSHVADYELHLPLLATKIEQTKRTIRLDRSVERLQQNIEYVPKYIDNFRCLFKDKLEHYHGVCENGERHGKGVHSYLNGEKYDGYWYKDKMHGQGVYTWPDGGKYVGEYKDGKKNGRGVYIWANGEKYDGEYKNGIINGRGVYTWPNGEKYDGEYKNGKVNGRGVHTWPNGEKYDGEYKNGIINGRGVYTWPDGGKYDGEYKDSEMNGRGVYTSPNGEKYDGEYKDGKMNGRGVMTYVNGDVYDGTWKDGAKVDESVVSIPSTTSNRLNKMLPSLRGVFAKVSPV